MEVLSTGGTGGKGGTGKTRDRFEGRIENFPTENDYGEGGDGSAAATASLTLDGSAVTITDTSDQAAYGVNVSSAGGDGGDGNDSQGNFGHHPGFGDGGAGGKAGEATLTLNEFRDRGDGLGRRCSGHPGLLHRRRRRLYRRT